MQVRTGTTLTMTTTTGAGHTTRVTGIMKTTATTMTGDIAKSGSSITLPHPGSAWWVFSWGKDPSESSSLVTPIVESLKPLYAAPRPG
jgi:hypothetical protein